MASLGSCYWGFPWQMDSIWQSNMSSRPAGEPSISYMNFPASNGALAEGILPSSLKQGRIQNHIDASPSQNHLPTQQWAQHQPWVVPYIWGWVCPPQQHHVLCLVFDHPYQFGCFTSPFSGPTIHITMFDGMLILILWWSMLKLPCFIVTSCENSRLLVWCNPNVSPFNLGQSHIFCWFNLNSRCLNPSFAGSVPQFSWPNSAKARLFLVSVCKFWSCFMSTIQRSEGFPIETNWNPPFLADCPIETPVVPHGFPLLIQVSAALQPPWLRPSQSQRFRSW